MIDFKGHRFVKEIILTCVRTIDFLLTARRDKKAALRFFKKAVRQHVLPDKAAIDKSAASTAAIEALKGETGHEIEIRQIKYLNNLVEQDRRAVKRIVRPMLGFQTFRCARATLQGLELMHMIKKGQRVAGDSQGLAAAFFCSSKRKYSQAARL